MNIFRKTTDLPVRVIKGVRVSVFLLCMALYVPALQAQGCKGAHDGYLSKLISEKSAYLQEKIGLTGKTAEEFANIYYDMEMKKFKVAHDVYRKAKMLRRSETKVSDDEYLESAKEQAEVSLKTGEIEFEFFNELKELLSPEQLFLFYHWERRFGKEMIRREQKK